MNRYLHANNLFRILGTLAVLLGLSACATELPVQVQRVSHTRYAPSASIQTLTHAPSQPYSTIAHLSVHGAIGMDRAQLLAVMLKKASSLGANALWIISENVEASDSAPIAFNPAGGAYQPSATQKIWTIQADALHIRQEAKK